MPFDALPPGFNNQQTGDWKNIWPFKYITPSWTAFGPRCTEWWAKWRAVPKLLVAFGGAGPNRYEADCMVPPPCTWFSAIQYWKPWGVQIQWPLFFAAHYYVDAPPTYPARADTQRVLFFRIGARRNADGFYDFPSAYVGTSFN